MPLDNDFNEQRKVFTKNLGVLNDSLGKATSNFKNQLSTQSVLVKKSGTINVKAMEAHTREIHAATKKLKSGVVQKEIELKSDKLEKTVKGLSDATSKLDRSSMAFHTSTKELSSSTKELNTSMGDVADITNKNMEKLKYLGDNIKKFGKWAAVGGAVGGGVLGYRALKGGAKAGAGVAAAPYKAGRSLLREPTRISEEVLGDVGTDLMSSYKKAFGLATLSGIGGGIVPGMFGKSMFFDTAKEGGSGEPGMGSRMVSGAGGMAKGTMSGLQIGMHKLVDFIAGFPKETRERGVFHMMPEEGDDFTVGPSEEFKSDLGSVADRVGETNDLISDPDVKTQSKVMTKSLTQAFEEGGKKGLFTQMFSSVFGIGATIGYALPIFGAGYRAELPQPEKYGLLGAMLKTLGLIYVHNRFASEEINDLMLQQSQLLQIGFEISGSLRRPKPRSLSEWLGKSIGQTLGGETGPLTFMKDLVVGKTKGVLENILGLGKEKGNQLAGLIPGYSEWKSGKGKKKEADELRASPALARRILLLSDIKTILSDMKDIMMNKGGSAMAKPISLAVAARQPHEITKTGAAELHAGETVSGGGGIFSKIFGGIGSLFSGGMFKKIKGWFVSIFEPLTRKIDELINWFKASFSFLEPAVKAMHEMKTVFGIGTTTKFTELGGGGGLLKEARGKKSIAGGIFNVIQSLPGIVERALAGIGDNIKKIFEQEINEKTGIGSILVKAYQKLFPEVFKKATGTIFFKAKEVINLALQGSVNISQSADRFLDAIKSYGDKVITPIQNAWKEGEGPLSKILKSIRAIPDALVESWRGLIPLGKKITNILTQATDIEGLTGFIMGIKKTFIVDIPQIMSEVRIEIMDKILPKTWSTVYKEIENRILEWGGASFTSTMELLKVKPGEIFKTARKKRPGIIGAILGVFDVIGVSIKAAWNPYKEFFIHLGEDAKKAWDGLKEYSFGQIINDFIDLGKNIRSVSNSIQENLQEFMAFTSGKPAAAMRHGGLIYAANGIVVGEAGPEAVLPLDNPKATDRISGMFANAFQKLGKSGIGFGGFEGTVINRLDTIISLLGGSPGTGTTKKAKVKQIGILRRIAGGMTDIATSIIKLPFSIGGNIAKGLAVGFKKSFGSMFNLALKSLGALVDVGKTTLTAIRTGLTGLRHSINMGFTSLKLALKTGWKVITAPFKAAAKVIMKPFTWIKDKITGFKEKVSEKVKGVIKWFKPGGKTAPIAVDQEGKYVYAKWPALLVKYTKGIHGMLAKHFGLGGLMGGGNITMMKSMLPALAPYIAGAAGIAGLAIAGYHAYKGVAKAREWHKVAEGEEVKTSQKVTAGIGGFLGGTAKTIGARMAIGAAKGAAIGAGVGAITGPGAAISAGIGAIAGGILGAVGGENIAKAVQFVWDPLKKVAVGLYDLVTWPLKIMTRLMEKFGAWAKGKIPGWGKGDELIGGMKSGDDKWLSGLFGKEKKMATGGIITRPLRALLGEAGPEAVIPLSRTPALARLVDDAALASSGTIAEHHARMEISRQQMNDNRILTENKKLREVLAAQKSGGNYINTNQIATSNNVTNAISTTGIQQRMDEETDKILSGRLN